MLRRLALLAALVVGIALGAGPADAITDGELDGNGHPYVGLMIAQDSSGTPLWRCSGTLISATVFLTAGHCTEAPAAHVEIWFAAGPIPWGTRNPRAVGPCGASTGYPCQGEVSGTPVTHPDYDPNQFFIRDLGAVVLDRAVQMTHYGELPTRNQLDSLKPRRSTTFTAVGYGLQKSLPAAIPGPEDVAFRTRMKAEPHLLQINGGIVGNFSVLLSNNANTGGTCFGDSGGPNFIGSTRVIGGVTSFGLNGTCGGTGGVFRVDRSWSLDWIERILSSH